MYKAKGKKLTAYILVLGMLFTSLLSGTLFNAHAEAVDLSAETITISSVEDFLVVCDPANFEAIRNKKIVLEADIDMEEQSPINPIGASLPFEGTFDGQKHTIKNLTINGSRNCTGLFGYIGINGQVINLGLDRVTVTGKTNTGTIAGANTGTIANCFAIGTVSGTNYIGGIAGMNHSGTIENCWVNVNVSGAHYVGGLFGGSDYNSRSTSASVSPVAERIANKPLVARNNLVTGTANGTNQTGGILADVGNSKASDSIIFEGNVAWLSEATGGASGTIFSWWSDAWSASDKSLQVSTPNVYWDGMIVGSGSGAINPNKLKITSATNDETSGLGSQTLYEDTLKWDFTSTWVWSDTWGHPVLQGFAVPEPYSDGAQYTPASIVTTFVDSPKTSRAFTWYTDISITNSIIQVLPKGKYSTESDFSGSDAITVNAISYTLQTAEDGTARNIHKVNLTGLTPGTTYYYRVGSGEYWSNVYSFTTEKESSDSFTFFSMTDTQNEYESYTNTLKYAISAYPKAEFILHSGDVIQNNSSADYDRVFKLTSPYSTSLPTMVTPGNHELLKDVTNGIFVPDYVNGLDNWKSHYQFPVNGPDSENQIIYSFDYGNAHFAVLDSNASTVSISKQIEWLKADMDSTDKAWKIVSIHTGPMDSYTDTKSSSKIVNELVQAMYDIGVDLVLFGHNHVLLRSDSVTIEDGSLSIEPSARSGATSYATAGGTVYYSSGCAGGIAGSLDTSNYWALYNNPTGDSTYGAITVTEDSITIKTHSVPNRYINLESKLLDTFVITKPINNTTVANIEKTSSSGSVDTYTITYTDGTTTTFTVTNGKNGVQGIQGVQGVQGIPGVQGVQGIQGEQGIQGDSGKDGHTPTIEIKDGYWYIDGVNTNILAVGSNGADGKDGSSSLLPIIISGISLAGMIAMFCIMMADRKKRN